MALKLSKRQLVPIAVVGAVIVWMIVVTILSTRRHKLPESSIVLSKEAPVIERGKYLAEGPGACIECHADPAVATKALADPAGFPPDTPMLGGRSFDLSLGVYFARNLTPDRLTGIGGFPAGQVAQLLRYSVNVDHRAIPQVMHNQDLADDDLTAIVAYLRSRPAVPHETPQPGWKLFAGVRLAFLPPAGPNGTPPTHVDAAPTAAYGRYLAHAVSDCYGCHTNQDLVSGAITGEPFAGGVATASTGDPKRFVVSPNITPDPKGKMAGVTEELFLAKFRSPTHPEGTSMPWSSFRKMTDDDLRAVFRYLATVKPVSNDPGPMFRPRS